MNTSTALDTFARWYFIYTETYETKLKTVAVTEAEIPREKLEDTLYSIPFYQAELRKHLPQNILKRTPSRLIYPIAFISLNIFLVYAVMTFELPWFAKLTAAVLIGIANTGLGFFAHETLHGSIVKNKILQDAIGFVGFGLFFISPTYWRFWHNYLHHGHTQLLIRDPDAFPTIGVYKRSPYMRFLFNLTPGSGKIVSYFYFFYWFCFQAIINQAYLRFGNKMWEKMNHTRVSIEFAAIILLLGGYVYLIGPSNLVWLALIPFAVQNYGVMSYISTNHNLSPLTKTNDPLVNSLTVTNHPIIEAVNLNFGYHVEHHIFPTMSCAHAKTVHKLLKQHFGDRYQHMSKTKAMLALYRTPRIYKNYTELIHPQTLKTSPTLTASTR